MNQTISLAGTWQFLLDTDKQGLKQHYERLPFSDNIELPNTVSAAQKGIPNDTRETGYLTDPYEMNGYTWYRKEITLPNLSDKEQDNLHIHLKLERTRISYLWIDNIFVGTFDSLIAPHIYDLTDYIRSNTFTITIMISNTEYKIAGGHMTSPDTQTNWNGILGAIELILDSGIRITHAHITGSTKEHALSLQLPVENDTGKEITVALSVTADILTLRPEHSFRISGNASSDSIPEAPDYLTKTCASPTSIDRLHREICTVTDTIPTQTNTMQIAAEGTTLQINYDLSDHETLWSEYHPNLYAVTVTLTKNASDSIADTILFQQVYYTGLKDFIIKDGAFIINGHRTLLRGKHDGMVFPYTGYAPMNVEGWLSVMQTAKDYGINHYRFHTCCPPEAAFLAADLLGIYLQPELPFWGTYYGPEDEEYPEEAQQFLRLEGFRMLEEFSDHPSYCLMSMGNELWGNPSAINHLMGEYKEFRPNILYTQGSNNFQWTPNIQPNDDFFSGVRFTIDRQIRGSYAMCDQPLGHVQTTKPNTRFQYEEAIHPSYQSTSVAASEDGTIEIQYGTGVKRVKLTEVQEELNPTIPVVSHEIGQYCTYPDYHEIGKYIGVLKARNFEVFRERLQDKHLDSLSDAYFENSGKLAAACYKDELETAFRSPSLAGFQLLDLQDFPGQGTALVGILNAFMENKGTITLDGWREFCSDAVLQAEFDSYILCANDSFRFTVSLAYYREQALEASTLNIMLTNARTGDQITIADTQVPVITENGRHILGEYCFELPETAKSTPAEWLFTLSITGTDIHNHYTLWSYPEKPQIQKAYPAAANASGSSNQNAPAIAYSMQKAKTLAQKHSKVLLFLSDAENTNSIQGTYCTDFWCYPMFRSISESIGKEIPIGTLGLLIRKEHPALADFPCKTYSTPQWFSIVQASRSSVLDDTDILPIVQTIDNIERNHRLGLLYEMQEASSTILVCTSDLPKLMQQGVPEAGQLYVSLVNYIMN